MKTICGICVALPVLALLLANGCYPKPPVCAPNDTSCLPCPDLRSTNPACPQWPSDATRSDGGTER